MKLTRRLLALAAASLVLMGFAVLGCGKSTSTTAPYGGGGGGGSTGGGGGGGSAAFDSGRLDAPANFVHTFAAAGTVHYHCTFHVAMGMVGTVNVVSGGPDSAVVAATGTSFSPPNVSIRPGGFVRWNINGGTHTVTSD